MKTEAKSLLTAILILLGVSSCSYKKPATAPVVIECKYPKGPERLHSELPPYRTDEDYFSPYNSTVWKERERIYNAIIDDWSGVIDYYESLSK